MVLAAMAAWARDGVPVALEGAGWVGRALSICFGSLVIGVLLLESLQRMPARLALAHRRRGRRADRAAADQQPRARPARAHAARGAHRRADGLANRRRFYEETELALAAGPAGLLLLDLNRFKEINDWLGHNSGDELLCDVAERLTSALPPGGRIARIGGDEFVVLLDARTERSALALPARVARRSRRRSPSTASTRR